MGDTRATEGPMVADKNCQKLHFIANNIYCAGAGTAADLEHTTQLMESQMESLRMATGTQPRVCTVVRRLSTMLFKYQGYIGCALVPDLPTRLHRHATFHDNGQRISCGHVDPRV